MTTVVAPPDPARRGSILVVDDDPAILKAILRSLTSAHDVVALPSATEALRRITSGERYDVIISDIAMPGMSGLELYDAILSVDPAIAATMVFLTGGACSAQAHAFLSRMTNQRIDKPFTPAQLRTFIELRLRS